MAPLVFLCAIARTVNPGAIISRKGAKSMQTPAKELSRLLEVPQGLLPQRDHRNPRPFRPHGAAAQRDNFPVGLACLRNLLVRPAALRAYCGRDVRRVFSRARITQGSTLPFRKEKLRRAVEIA